MTAKGKHTPVATYPFQDEDGGLLYESLRYDPKDFRQRRPDGHGGYEWNLKGVRRVPYRLPELLIGIEDGKDIYVVEGEKDADSLIERGFCATTNAGGCNWPWTASFIEHFRRAKSNRVIVIPDCDEADEKVRRRGREAARDNAALLRALVDDVRPLDLAPHKHDGYDVTDWFGDGHTADELRELAERAPSLRAAKRSEPAPSLPWVAAPDYIQRSGEAAGQSAAAERPKAEFVRVGDLLKETHEEVRQLVDGILRSGSTAMIASKPKVGKSSFLMTMALCVARGTAFLGRATIKGIVLYVALEGNRREWRARFREMGATDDDDILLYVGRAPLEAMKWLRESAEQYQPILIVIDTLQQLIRLKDMNDYAAVTNASEPIIEIAQTFNATLVLAHHEKKKGGEDGDGVLGSTGLFGFVDTLVTLKKGSEGRRTMKTVQRFGDEMAETVLVLDQKTKLVSAAGARYEVDRAVCESLILAALSGEWIDRATLLVDIDGRGETKSAALKQLVDDGRAIREGAGRKGDPFLYALPGTPSLADRERSQNNSFPDFPPSSGNHKNESYKPLHNNGLFVSQDHSNGDGGAWNRETNSGHEPAESGNAGNAGNDYSVPPLHVSNLASSVAGDPPEKAEIGENEGFYL